MNEKKYSRLSSSSESNKNDIIKRVITSKCDIIEEIGTIAGCIAGMLKKA